MRFSGFFVFVGLMLSTQLHALELNPTLRSIIAMPGQQIVLDNPNQSTLSTQVAALELKQLNHQWQLTAPTEPGFYTLTHTQQTNHTPIQLVVMTPFETHAQKSINNYTIGHYPKPYKGLEQYSPPQGLIEVNKSDLARYVTPHVQLQQLMCKQAAGFPKYVYVTQQGLGLLEDLLTFVQAQNVKVSRFAFISAYRTPFYNKSIGNGTHSRHQYGDAFDLYIDEDNDGRMDDLNHDGKHNSKDVDYLYTLFVKFLAQSDYSGGVGRYYPASHHGGFVHIDNRGFSARW